MTWRDVSVVLWTHNPRVPEVLPGTLGVVVAAVLAKTFVVPDFDPWVYEYVRLGDLTPEVVKRLRYERNLPDAVCPLCNWNGSFFMRIRSSTHDVVDGVVAKCVCVVTRHPQDSDADKLRRLRFAGLSITPEQVAEMGLDYSWRPTTTKRRARRSFTPDEEPATFE